MATYLPIEEHGIVGDLRTVALVDTDGTVDWYCPARFDAPSLFASLLDADKGGFFSLCCRGRGGYEAADVTHKKFAIVRVGDPQHPDDLWAAFHQPSGAPHQRGLAASAWSGDDGVPAGCETFEDRGALLRSQHIQSGSDVA